MSVAVADWPGAGMLMLAGFDEMLKSVTVTVTGAESDGA